jgi:hypothetical protein
MAVWAIAIGAMMVELRVTGASGVTAASAGRRSLGRNQLIAAAMATMAATPMTAPMAILAQGERMRPPDLSRLVLAY